MIIVLSLLPLQAICPSIDGLPRDVYRLPGIEPLEAWVQQDALGLFEPP